MYRLAKLCALLMFAAGLQLAAQTGVISGQAIDQYGRPLPHASVRVCSATATGLPCSPTVPIYLNYNLTTPVSNPYSADQFGNYSFYVPVLPAPNIYQVQLSPAHGITWTYLFDGPATGSGSGSVNSVSCTALAPLFTCNVATPSTTPVINFTLDTAQSYGFFGNIQGSTANPSYVTLIQGSGIVFTPNVGSNPKTLIISTAPISGGCQGTVTGDNTSTNCGFNNRTGDTASTPASVTTFGSNLLGTNSADNVTAVGTQNGSSNTGSQVVFVGNSNGAGNEADESILVGDTNGAGIPLSSPLPANIIGVGNDNLDTLSGSLSNMVCEGDQNCRDIAWFSDAVAIGNSNLWHSHGTSNPNSLSQVVALGLSNVQYINTGGPIIGIGEATAGGETPSGSTAVFEVIGIGDSAAQTVGSNSDDILAIGDGSANTIAEGSADVVAIGDGAFKQCGTISGCVSVPNPLTINDIVAIGDVAASFNQGSNIVAIGDQALGSNAVGAGLGYYNQGDFNVAIGAFALVANSTGNHNTAFGSYAGADGFVLPSTWANSNHTGSNNTWIGYDAGPGTATQLSNTIALGYTAHNSVSNQTVIGNASVTSLMIYGSGDGYVIALLFFFCFSFVFKKKKFFVDRWSC